MLLYTYFQKTRQTTRRGFEEMVTKKLVAVNNELVTALDHEIGIGDLIQLSLTSEDGDEQLYSEEVEYLPGFSPKLVLFHKPKGYVCSKKDAHNKIIYEILPESWHDDFWYIGRLDKESTGLLLLTNESKLVDQYENPFHDVHKVYEVIIDKPLRTKDIKKMCAGQYVTRDGELSTEQAMKKSVDTDLLGCVYASYVCHEHRHIVRITLNEGKYRHIRRLLSALGYRVIELKRVKVGKWTLGSLKVGKRRVEDASRVLAGITTSKKSVKKNSSKKFKKFKKSKKLKKAKKPKKIGKRAKRARKGTGERGVKRGGGL